MTEDREPVHHLQQAVLEMIAAARAALNLLEDVVNDPAAVSKVLESVASTIRAPAPPEDPAPVEHIPVR
jgi:hypothetical protein